MQNDAISDATTILLLDGQPAVAFSLDVLKRPLAVQLHFVSVFPSMSLVSLTATESGSKRTKSRMDPSIMPWSTTMNFADDGGRTDFNFVPTFTQIMIMPAKSRNRHPNFSSGRRTNQGEKTGMTPQPLWCRRQPAVRKFNKLLKKKPFNEVEGYILYLHPSR